MDGEWKVKGSGRFEVGGEEKEGERRETEKAVLLGFTGPLTPEQVIYEQDHALNSNDLLLVILYSLDKLDWTKNENPPPTTPYCVLSGYPRLFPPLSPSLFAVSSLVFLCGSVGLPSVIPHPAPANRPGTFPLLCASRCPRSALCPRLTCRGSFLRNRSIDPSPVAD